MAVQTFEDLEVWKKSCRLAVEVCHEIEGVKPYALQDQINRAAISISSNIAEGSERDSPGDFIRFLRIAKGSCAELRTQLYIHQRLSNKNQKPAITSVVNFIEETRAISAMLQALIFAVEKRKN